MWCEFPGKARSKTADNSYNGAAPLEVRSCRHLTAIHAPDKGIWDEVRHNKTNGRKIGMNTNPIPSVRLLIPEKAAFFPNLLTDAPYHGTLNIGQC
jgi:hypothetical protein